MMFLMYLMYRQMLIYTKYLLRNQIIQKKYTFDVLERRFKCVFDYNLDAKSELVSLEWITQQSASIFAFTALWQ